jgi:uncharacterized protein
MSSAYTFEDFETFTDADEARSGRERRPPGRRRGGRSRGGRGQGGGILPRRVLEFSLESIVDEPDAIEISQFSEGDEIIFEVHVAQVDMGRVIGRKGRVAQALRSLVSAAALKEGTRATVDIVD